jgi:hypothetical protein
MEVIASEHLEVAGPLPSHSASGGEHPFCTVRYLATVSHPGMPPVGLPILCAQHLLFYVFMTVKFGHVLKGAKSPNLPPVSDFAHFS